LKVYKVENGSVKKARFPFLFQQKKTIETIDVSFAITDISAMEIQFHSRDIPCCVIIDAIDIKQLYIPKKITSFYERNVIAEQDKIIIRGCPEEIKAYLIGYDYPYLAGKEFSERIKWLCNHVHEMQAVTKFQLISSY